LRAVAQGGGVALVQRPDQALAPVMPKSALDLCPGARALSLEEIAAYFLEAVPRL
ncbi:chemotaxis protein CheB, partial [Listeria monocytogenes]|uniref:chemotaxis protein CheB n=1 Tax=Listeria monocytogenes TaxID=1639 RepID=UPI003FA40F30